MKVCYITMAFPAPYETFACSDVRALVRAGVSVTVRTLRPARRDRAHLLEEQRLERLPVDHNSVWATWRGLGFGLFHPAIFLRLLVWLVHLSWRRPDHLARSLILVPRALDILAAMRADPPDVVHLFWGHYPAMVGHLVERHLPGVVVSMFLGAYDLVWEYGPSAPVAKRADAVWTHSRVNVPSLERLGVKLDRIRVCHRGLEFERFSNALLPKVQGRVVSVGRLMPGKGMDDVLRALAIVLPRHPAATLIVLGDGPDRARLESLADTLRIRHAVTFTGRVAQDRVRDELTRADVMLYMAHSVTDRLPNVLKEAMAARCVCVVASAPSIEELLEDGVHGLIVRSGDVDAAAEKVQWALDNPEGAAALGGAARAHVRDHFDVDHLMGVYVARWTELVAEQTRVRGRGPIDATPNVHSRPSDAGQQAVSVGGAARPFSKT